MLLAQILEYLLDKPLATLSFRTLAKALDVSAFTLVYHFGSRAELLNEIVSAISVRELDIQNALRDSPHSLETYFTGLAVSWEWSVQPRNIQLQRLEFEASVMEALNPGNRHFTRELHSRWRAIGYDAMIDFGISEADAEIESRLIVGLVFGLQYDLVVNQDVEGATAAFTRAMVSHRQRLETLMREAGTRVQ